MAKPVMKTESTDIMTEADIDFEKEIMGDLGKGVSTAAADNLVPLIYVLQPLSPQVMNGPAQIEGAHPGDIWLKNYDPPIINGKEGIWFMPCAMYQRWTEWIPREAGGGFVGSYDYTTQDEPPPGAVRDPAVKNRPRFWFPQNGHECVDTRYEAGLVWHNGMGIPYVIPFKSTGHAVSRGWMTKRTRLYHPGGGIWPAWSHIYRLQTELKKNNLGSWYVFKIGEPINYIPKLRLPTYNKEAVDIVGGNPQQAYQKGKALAAAFETGQKIHEQEDSDVGAPDVGAGPPEQQMKDEIPF